MAGFFYKLGRLLGPKVRQANWMVQSVAGSEADVIRAEEQVGRDLAQSFLEQTEMDDDPAVLEVLQEVGGRLVPCVKDKQRKFRFIAGRSRELNAYALPGTVMVNPDSHTCGGGGESFGTSVRSSRLRVAGFGTPVAAKPSRGFSTWESGASAFAAASAAGKGSP